MEYVEFEREHISDGRPIVIYGAAIVGEFACMALQDMGATVLCFCDRAKAGQKVLDLPVIAPGDLKQHADAHILMAVGAAFPEVKRYLVAEGYRSIHSIQKLIDGARFGFDRETTRGKELEKVPELYRVCVRADAHPEELHLLSVDYIITERCTLRCRNCSNLMQYYTRPLNYDVAQLHESFGRLLATVDTILDLRIIGGEPFVHKELPRVVDRFHGEPKVKTISIFTNATILPDARSLEVMRHDKVRLVLTDYGALSKNTARFIEVLKEHRIRHTIIQLTSWQDLGELRNRGYTQEQVRAIYRDCDCKNLPSFLKGKLYLCPPSAHGANLKAFKDSDHVDFSDLSKPVETLREDLRRLLTREYLTACGYCSGRSMVRNKIAPAVQARAPLQYAKDGE